MATTIAPTVPVAAVNNGTCLLGSPASQIVRLSVCFLSALLNCVVLAAVFRSSKQAKGFSLLVAIDVFMNLGLSVRSGMAYVVDTGMYTNCIYLKWFTNAWKVSYLTRSWWMVTMTSARYTVVVRPMAAAIEFNYRQQVGCLCALTAFSAAFTIAMDVINSRSSFEYVYDVTISVEVVLSTGVPIVVVMALTCVMSSRLIRRRRMWTDLPANVDSNLKATKTLLLVSGSFFVLSFPHLFYELALSINKLLSRSMPTWLDLLGEVKSLLISIDSGLNFAIYFVMCRNFRIQLLGFLHIRVSCLQPKVNNRKVSCGLRCPAAGHGAGHQQSAAKELRLLRPARSPTPSVAERSSCFESASPAAAAPSSLVSNSPPPPPQRHQFDGGYV